MKKIYPFLIGIIFTISSGAFAAHGPQGTGNYKGKRDKHEKPTPQNEKKKKSEDWINLKNPGKKP